MPVNVHVGINDDNAYNLTLVQSTWKFCYLRLEQPLRGDGVFIDSQEFDVMGPDEQQIFYYKDGSQPLEDVMSNEESE